MPCLDENAILDVVHGRLAPEVVGEIDRHCADCEDCRCLLIEAREQSAPGESPPDPLRSDDGARSGEVRASSQWLAALGLDQTGGIVGRLEALAAGQSVEGYVLERCIGEGGMGVVWSATRPETGERVALKFLKTIGGEQASRMVREAKIAASVQHPGVVRVLEILTKDSPVIVMELLPGESLARALRRRGKLDLREAADVITPVIDAVSAVHAAGIVHRDLKPANIFLVDAPARGVKVLDFGLAKRARLDEGAESSGSGITRTGAMVGTPHYMAPEQIFGEKTIDARADAWAIGVILYECLTGSRPFRGDHFGQVIKSVTMGSIPPVESVAAVPPSVAGLVKELLSREPEQRPSLSRVREVLVAAAQGEPAPAQAGTADEDPRDSLFQQEVAAPPLDERRSRMPQIVLGAGLILALGAVGVGLTMGGEPARSEPPGGASRAAGSSASSEEPSTAAPVAALDSVAISTDRDAASISVSASPGPVHPRGSTAPSAKKASSAVPSSSANKLPGGVQRDPPY